MIGRLHPLYGDNRYGFADCSISMMQVFGALMQQGRQDDSLETSMCIMLSWGLLPDTLKLLNLCAVRRDGHSTNIQLRAYSDRPLVVLHYCCCCDIQWKSDCLPNCPKGNAWSIETPNHPSCNDCVSVPFQVVVPINTISDLVQSTMGFGTMRYAALHGVLRESEHPDMQILWNRCMSLTTCYTQGIILNIFISCL